MTDQEAALKAARDYHISRIDGYDHTRVCPEGNPCGQCRDLAALILASHAREAVEKARPEIERPWREHLAYSHPCTRPGALYCDDGELQCNACGIDFRRDSVESIGMRFAELTGSRRDARERERRDIERKAKVEALEWARITVRRDLFYATAEIEAEIARLRAEGGERG